MARKNNLRSEASGAIHFDARTKTVMAGASQENIKEKVQAVREVVPGKSNNEVHMVLQYYDYSVETAIQAYLEDGAKEALGEWSLKGSKQPNKKHKNKKKGTGEKAVEKSASSQLPTSMSEKDDTSASADSHLPNGEISQVIHESQTDPSTSISNNPPPAAQTEDISASRLSDVLPPAAQREDISASRLSDVLPPTTYVPTASVSVALPAQPLPQRQSHGRGRRNVIHESQTDPSSSISNNPPPAAQTEDISASRLSDVLPPATYVPTASVSVALPAQSLPQRQSHGRGRRSGVIHESQTDPSSSISNNPPPAAQTEDISASRLSDVLPPTTYVPTASVSVALPAQSLPQRQSHGRGRRSGDSHHSQPEHKISSKEMPAREVSSGPSMGAGHRGKPQQGLEKAIKDLHRQTTSLERLRHLLDHEIDRSYKSVKTVFEELRQGLNDREAQLMAEMNVLKQEASDMLEMRQNKAADFRKQVDRSDRLRDIDVSELRAEIKHFVSERRHDDNLGRTTRFLYDSDRVMDEIKKFGQVVHVKSMYTAHSVSTSSVDSCGNSQVDSVAANRDIQPPPHLEKINHLQDRLESSLKLQSSDGSHKSGKHPNLIQNGAHNHDTIPSNAVSSSSSSPRVLPVEGNSKEKKGSNSSIQGSSFSQNTNSFGRGRCGGNTQGPRGRGRGDRGLGRGRDGGDRGLGRERGGGDRGLGRGRGGFNGDRPRAQYDNERSYQRPSHTSYGSSKNKLDPGNDSEHR